MLGRGVVISKGAMVAAEAKIEGDVFIGPGTVINPLCEIRSISGPIIIGEDNIFEERVTVVCNYESDLGINIGSLNLFEVGSYIESTDIGNCNLIRINSRLNRNTSLANGCVIGISAFLDENEELDNHTVVYRKNEHCHKHVQPRAHTLHFSMLRKYLDVLREPGNRHAFTNWNTLKMTS
jgi:dynactin 6